MPLPFLTAENQERLINLVMAERSISDRAEAQVVLDNAPPRDYHLSEKDIANIR